MMLKVGESFMYHVTLSGVYYPNKCVEILWWMSLFSSLWCWWVKGFLFVMFNVLKAFHVWLLPSLDIKQIFLNAHLFPLSSVQILSISCTPHVCNKESQSSEEHLYYYWSLSHWWMFNFMSHKFCNLYLVTVWISFVFSHTKKKNSSPESYSLHIFLSFSIFLLIV